MNALTCRYQCRDGGEVLAGKKGRPSKFRRTGVGVWKPAGRSGGCERPRMTACGAVRGGLASGRPGGRGRGQVAERLKAAVLKTANPQGFVGSNPTLSASLHHTTVAGNVAPLTEVPLLRPLTHRGWRSAQTRYPIETVNVRRERRRLSKVGREVPRSRVRDRQWEALQIGTFFLLLHVRVRRRRCASHPRAK